MGTDRPIINIFETTSDVGKLEYNETRFDFFASDKKDDEINNDNNSESKEIKEEKEDNDFTFSNISTTISPEPQVGFSTPGPHLNFSTSHLSSKTIEPKPTIEPRASIEPRATITEPVFKISATLSAPSHISGANRILKETYKIEKTNKISTALSSAALSSTSLLIRIKGINNEGLLELIPQCYVSAGYINGRRIFCKPYKGYITFTDLLNEINHRYSFLTLHILGRHDEYEKKIGINANNNNSNNNNNNDDNSNNSLTSLNNVFSHVLKTVNWFMNPYPWITKEEEITARKAIIWYLKARKLVADLLERSNEDARYLSCIFRGWDRLVNGYNTGNMADTNEMMIKHNRIIEFMAAVREKRNEIKTKGGDNLSGNNEVGDRNNNSSNNSAARFFGDLTNFVNDLCIIAKYH